MPDVERITFNIDRVEFTETGRGHYAQRPLVFRGVLAQGSGSETSVMGRGTVPQHDPYMIGLGAMDSWTAEINVKGKMGVRSRFEVHDPENVEADGLVDFVDVNVSRPYKDTDWCVETEYFNLYGTVQCVKAPANRRARSTLNGTRANLQSEGFTPVLTLIKRQLRAVLMAPATGAGTAPAILNRSVRKKLEIPDDLPADGPHARVEYLLATLKDMDDVLKQAPYKAQEDEVERRSGRPLLRLFVAPEWYFRRDTRPYTPDELFTAIERLKSRSTQDPFNRWLIVPGSVFWGFPTEHKMVETMEKDKQDQREELKTLQRRIDAKKSKLRVLDTHFREVGDEKRPDDAYVRKLAEDTQQEMRKLEKRH